MQRKKDKLCEVISRFGHLKDIEKKAIINKSCDETNIQLDNEPENYLQVNEFGQRMLQSLKGLTCNSIKNRDQFCGSLHLVYGNDLMKDDETLSWLAKELDTKPHRLKTLMENWLHVDSDNRGKHRALTTETKNAIFTCWTLNSIVTVDRRNGRDVALMKKSEYDEKYGEIDVPTDFIIEEDVTKRGICIVKTTRRIATKTVRQIQLILKNKTVQISIGSIIKLIPFFVGNPTERERRNHVYVDFVIIFV